MKLTMVYTVVFMWLVRKLKAKLLSLQSIPQKPHSQTTKHKTLMRSGNQTYNTTASIDLAKNNNHKISKKQRPSSKKKKQQLKI